MKTKNTLSIFSVVFLLFLSFSAQAGLLFTYHKLALKDLDQMNELIHSKIKESKKSSSGKVVPLKEALQSVLSRPDEDGMIDKILSPLRTQIEAHNAWEKTLNELTTEAVNALTNTRAFKPDVQVTYAVFLENLLGELKPSANVDGWERKLITKIRDAKIEMTKEALKERKLRIMKTPVSPSEIAGMILDSTKVEELKAAPAAPAAPEPAPLEGNFEE